MRRAGRRGGGDRGRTRGKSDDNDNGKKSYPICFIRNGFASIRNVLLAFIWKTASKSLRMSYDHYRCLDINKIILTLLTKMLRKQ